MDYSNSYPQKHLNSEIDDAAIIAFSAEISSYKYFQIQTQDKKDYGVDIQLELLHNRSSVTNIRVHAQLKGTQKSTNKDGSVSISVDRSNLNYLENHPGSIYICYHIPSNRLMFRYALDIFREYEHNHINWHDQKSVTVRFIEPFDQNRQMTLHAHVFEVSKSERMKRREWAITPPDKISEILQGARNIHIPPDPVRAKIILDELYEQSEDAVISKHYDIFVATLSSTSSDIMPVHMAETNIGLNYKFINRDRILSSVQFFQNQLERKSFDRGSLLYCIGNGYLGLGEYENARDYYNLALQHFFGTENKNVTAMCLKNMGTTQEMLGNYDTALKFFEDALGLDPNLMEANFSIGLWHHRHGNNPQNSLEYFDKVVTNFKREAVQGWRIEILFLLNNPDSAFREIQNLLGDANIYDWIWPWCAQLVATHGQKSVPTAKKSLLFWNKFIQNNKDNNSAKIQRLLCICYLKISFVNTGINFDQFKQDITMLLDDIQDDGKLAYIWDRVGHYAQEEKNWIEAEKAYSKAYRIDPERYAYCLGTALNALGEHEKALPIVIKQANSYPADAKSWFQVGHAYSGINENEKSIDAYKKAIELDQDYDLAWFNLGGIYHNSGKAKLAIETWTVAIQRFPEHELTKMISTEFRSFFDHENN